MQIYLPLDRKETPLPPYPNPHHPFSRQSNTTFRTAAFLPLVGLVLSSTAAHPQQFADATATHFPSPGPAEFTNQVSVGDLNGDGHLDLVFANGGGFATAGTPEVQRIYINDGSGNFTDESASRLGWSGLCRGVEMGDMDDDGDLDLIFAQDFERRPALFRNDGTGVFTDVTAAQLPNIALSSSRAQFADIDNDGDLDLYLASGDGNRFGCDQYRIFVNDDAGFFTDETASRHPTENTCENMDVIFADIDGDFDLDVKTASTGTANSRLYRNDSSGVFSLVTTIPADATSYSYDFGDIDGDGDLDLLGANARPGSSSEFLLRNDGNAVFTDISDNVSPNPSEDDNDTKFVDYDNDGDLDLIIARIGGGEKTYENDGTGRFTQTTGVIEQIGDSSLDIAVADLDGDGRFDVVTAQGESGDFINRIYLSSGPLDTRPPRIIATEDLPDTSDTNGPYVVRALILDDMSSDRNFFADQILLTYTVDSGDAQVIEMKHSGGQVYRGEIPGQAGGIVQYQVSAEDQAGNIGTGLVEIFQVTLGAIFSDGFESGDTAAWSATFGQS
ncbi:MAG: VCBS repeat-containing protein [Deltaproteobacteria bacterium]|nr:VCBS repeat-containing protein [Deltaproteobacteria bacterium]